MSTYNYLDTNGVKKLLEQLKLKGLTAAANKLNEPTTFHIKDGDRLLATYLFDGDKDPVTGLREKYVDLGLKEYLAEKTHQHAIGDIDGLTVSLQNLNTSVTILTTDFGTIRKQLIIDEAQIAANKADIEELKKVASKVNDVQVDGVSVVDPVTKIADISSNAFISAKSKGKPLGVAELDAAGKVPVTQLPPISTSSVEVVDSYEQLERPGKAGILYITKNDNKFYKWDLTELDYTEVGSDVIDPELWETVLAHIANTENPHVVTKVQVGLGNVDNTKDADKPISTATQTALDTKVNISDVIDNVLTVETQKPLSANQGTQLKKSIDAVNSKVTSLGSSLHFKGVVSSESELPTDAQQGDCWQVKTDTISKMMAWTGTAWVEIAASVMDITVYIATAEEIDKIIKDYK